MAHSSETPFSSTTAPPSPVRFRSSTAPGRASAQAAASGPSRTLIPSPVGSEKSRALVISPSEGASKRWSVRAQSRIRSMRKASGLAREASWP